MYASTRTEELSVVPWTEAQKAAFLRMQFDAQDAYYRSTYPDARFLVITRDGDPVGRLYVARLGEEVRIIDIALLPGHRGAGIGSQLIRDVIDEAAQAGLPVRLQVEPWNPAHRLYERLGFRTIIPDAIHELMELAPPGQLNAAS